MDERGKVEPIDLFVDHTTTPPASLTPEAIRNLPVPQCSSLLHAFFRKATGHLSMCMLQHANAGEIPVVSFLTA